MEWDERDDAFASSDIEEVRCAHAVVVVLLPILRLHQSMPSSPTYLYDPDFTFPDNDSEHDGGISRWGYSKIFRCGFWSQVRLSLL